MDDDLRTSLRNITHLKEEIIKIDENTKEGLSLITKEIGNKIIHCYDNFSNAINEQRCENLHLQLEIANLNKEKNSLRFDIKNLVNSIKKLETLLGVDPDPKFDHMSSNNLMN